MQSFEDSNNPGYDQFILGNSKENIDFPATFSIKDKAFIKFGMISIAYQHFLYVKEKFNENFYIAKKEFLEAKKERFFSYDDFYENSFLMKETDFLKSQNYKMVASFEKHLKKLKHEFNEEFRLIPEFQEFEKMISNLDKNNKKNKNIKP